MVYLDPMVYFLTNGDAEVVRFNTTDLNLEFKFPFKDIADFLVIRKDQTFWAVTESGLLFSVSIANLPVIEYAETIDLQAMYPEYKYFTGLSDLTPQSKLVTGWSQD